MNDSKRKMNGNDRTGILVMTALMICLVMVATLSIRIPVRLRKDTYIWETRWCSSRCCF